MALRKTLLKIKHSKAFEALAGWSFEHASYALPVNRLKETAHLIAFHHPRPGYPVHILIVPKKAVPGLTGLDVQNPAFLQDLFHTVQALVKELDLERSGYRLIVNGGAYQDFPQLHFHLISGSELTPPPSPAQIHTSKRSD
jgi:histidine triad (HIT) family protein